MSFVLRRQQQVVELREKSRADAAIASAQILAMTPTKEKNVEVEIEKHTSALREEMRHLRDSAARERALGLKLLLHHFL